MLQAFVKRSGVLAHEVPTPMVSSKGVLIKCGQEESASKYLESSICHQSGHPGHFSWASPNSKLD